MSFAAAAAIAFHRTKYPAVDLQQVRASILPCGIEPTSSAQETPSKAASGREVISIECSNGNAESFNSIATFKRFEGRLDVEQTKPNRRVGAQQVA
jgi:hypothetical protein